MSSPSSDRRVSVDPARLKLTSEDGTKGTLLGSWCRDCGVYCFGPATFCQACTSGALDSVELGQRGTLYSFTVVHVPPEGWPGPVPYILAQVELPEGPHVLAEMVDCRESDLKIGMGVELALQTVNSPDGVSQKVVYKWRPVTSELGLKTTSSPLGGED